MQTRNVNINFKLTISYIGTNFCGWQTQPNERTVQNTIENVLQDIFNKKINLRYPSRTDSGVHAFDQIASFKVDTNYTSYQLLNIINNNLPKDIAVLNIENVNDDFDAKKANSKTYLYKLYVSQVLHPFKRNRVWWHKQEIDIEKLKQVAQLFIGKKDFASFMGSGSQVLTTIRTVQKIEIKQEGSEIYIYITAKGFLKHMVRNIVGTMMDFIRDKYSENDIIQIFEAKDRQKAGLTAPACGLYLYKVFY